MRLTLLYVLVALFAGLVGYLASLYLGPHSTIRALDPPPQLAPQPLVRPGAIVCPLLQRVCVGGHYYDLYISPVFDGAGKLQSCASSW